MLWRLSEHPPAPRSQSRDSVCTCLARLSSAQFSSVAQSCQSRSADSATAWTAARQASLPSTRSRSSLTLTSSESAMPGSISPSAVCSVRGQPRIAVPLSQPALPSSLKVSISLFALCFRLPFPRLLCSHECSRLAPHLLGVLYFLPPRSWVGLCDQLWPVTREQKRRGSLPGQSSQLSARGLQNALHRDGLRRLLHQQPQGFSLCADFEQACSGRQDHIVGGFNSVP